MKRIIEFLKGLFDLRCRFHDKCPYFDESSYTCTNEGGDYCGKFRELDK